MLVDIWVDSGVEGPSTLCQVDDWVDRGVEGTSTPLPVDNRRQGGRRSISTSLQVDDWVDKFKFCLAFYTYTSVRHVNVEWCCNTRQLAHRCAAYELLVPVTAGAAH